MKYEILLTK